MVSTLKVIGTSAPRADGIDKVTGKARYTFDTVLPGTLWAKSLRSPYASARIVSIDTSNAKGMPGVHAVLTGADVRGVRFGRRLQDVPVLAGDIVRFAGERVAAVCADSPEIAADARPILWPTSGQLVNTTKGIFLHRAENLPPTLLHWDELIARLMPVCIVRP